MACIAPRSIPVLRQERPAAVPEARRPGMTIQERRGVPELSYIGFPVSHTEDFSFRYLVSGDTAVRMYSRMFSVFSMNKISTYPLMLPEWIEQI